MVRGQYASAGRRSSRVMVVKMRLDDIWQQRGDQARMFLSSAVDRPMDPAPCQNRRLLKEKDRAGLAIDNMDQEHSFSLHESLYRDESHQARGKRSIDDVPGARRAQQALQIDDRQEGGTKSGSTETKVT